MNSRPAFAAEASSRIPNAGYHLISALKKFPFAFWRSLRETKNPFPFSRELKGIARCGLLVTRHPPRPGRGPSPAIRHQAFVHVHLQVHESFHLPTSTPRPSREAAFSLTEVVIALGIFAVSMVGILALFPVASSTGRESSDETQAAILAQTILDDLVDSAERRGFANAFIIVGPNTVQTGTWRAVNLNNNATYYVAYDIRVRVGPPAFGEGMKGNPITLKATNWPSLQASHWSSGVGVPANVAYLARVDVQAITNFPQFSRVTVTVETPPSVASTNRRSFTFASLLQGR